MNDEDSVDAPRREKENMDEPQEEFIAPGPNDPPPQKEKPAEKGDG